MKTLTTDPNPSTQPLQKQHEDYGYGVGRGFTQSKQIVNFTIRIDRKKFIDNC